MERSEDNANADASDVAQRQLRRPTKRTKIVRRRRRRRPKKHPERNNGRKVGDPRNYYVHLHAAISYLSTIHDDRESALPHAMVRWSRPNGTHVVARPGSHENDTLGAAAQTILHVASLTELRHELERHGFVHNGWGTFTCDLFTRQATPDELRTLYDLHMGDDDGYSDDASSSSDGASLDRVHDDHDGAASRCDDDNSSTTPDAPLSEQPTATLSSSSLSSSRGEALVTVRLVDDTHANGEGENTNMTPAGLLNSLAEADRCAAAQEPIISDAATWSNVEFLERLHQTLNNLYGTGTDDLVTWSQTGQTVRVRSANWPTPAIPYRNAPEFQAALKLHGFRRLTGNDEKSWYYCNGFSRGASVAKIKSLRRPAPNNVGKSSRERSATATQPPIQPPVATVHGKNAALEKNPRPVHPGKPSRSNALRTTATQPAIQQPVAMMNGKNAALRKHPRPVHPAKPSWSNEMRTTIKVTTSGSNAVTVTNSASAREAHRTSIYSVAWSLDVHLLDRGRRVRLFAACAQHHVTVYAVPMAPDAGAASDPFVAMSCCKCDDIAGHASDAWYACAFAGRTVEATNATLSLASSQRTAHSNMPNDLGRDAIRRELAGGAATGAQTLCVGGQFGTILVLDVQRGMVIWNLLGHGGAIYDLQACPTDPWLLLSAAQDRSARIWNLRTGGMVAVLAGHHGHIDPVVAACWHMHGHCIATSGHDTSIRLWDVRPLSSPLAQAIEASHGDATAQFQFGGTVHRRACVVTPFFCTDQLHIKVVDCVQFVNAGNNDDLLLLSKSTEDRIVMWSPILALDGVTHKSDSANNIVIHRIIDLKHADEWYLRFDTIRLSAPSATATATSPTRRECATTLLVAGNCKGTIKVWDISLPPADNSDSNKPLFTVQIEAPRTPWTVVHMVRWSCGDGTMMLLASGNDGTLWKWDVNVAKYLQKKQKRSIAATLTSDDRTKTAHARKPPPPPSAVPAAQSTSRPSHDGMTGDGKSSQGSNAVM